MDSEVQDPGWFAVRCVFRTGWAAREQTRPVYEERITLWRARSVEEAVSRAEAEAETYASMIDDAPDEYLGLAQAYRLEEAPADGSELFSLMRESDLPPEDYLDACFDTGGERAREL